MTFLKMSKDGSQLSRSFLLLKDNEINSVEEQLAGLGRLSAKGWDVPEDIDEVVISGKEVRRVNHA